MRSRPFAVRDIGWPPMAAESNGRLRRVLAGSAPLRVRITAVAVLVVGLALVVGSVALVSLLRTNLIDSSRQVAENRADSLVSQLSTNGDISTLTDVGDEEFVQILNQTGKVLAATKNARGQRSLRVPEDSKDIRSVSFDDDPYVVVAENAKTPQGVRVVVAGSSLEDAQDATGSLAKLLLIGSPLMVLFVGALTWFGIGRTLAPVDRIRREADEIGATELHRRLPEPPRQDEIGRLARTMNRMLDRLDYAQQQQRRFIADAAHELRSPIASIKQNLEVAATYPEHLSTSEMTEAVMAESDRLERLIVALLRLAHLDERSPERSGIPVDLDDLVLAEVQRLKNATSLRIDASAVSAGRVGGDEALLAQMLRNVVDNAEHHAQTTIALTLAEYDKTVTLSVEDDGPGVPAADRERIFERFVRLDESRARDAGGSGLGLAIVHDIVNAYSGTVAVTESNLGGARFLITLPRLADGS